MLIAIGAAAMSRMLLSDPLIASHTPAPKSSHPNVSCHCFWIALDDAKLNNT